MEIKEIKLKDFRNYAELTIPFDSDINVLLGANGQGKTNVLEALYYGSGGKSHRTNSDEDLIRFGQNEGKAEISYVNRVAEQHLAFHFIRGKRRIIQYNQAKIRPKELIGLLNAVLFSPEDLWLIKGPPALRRRFLDREISQTSPLYYEKLSHYQKILFQRNHLLKQIQEKKSGRSLLEPWNIQLAEAAAQVVYKRLEALKKLNMLTHLLQRRLTQNEESLTLNYQFTEESVPSLEQITTQKLTDWYYEKLQQSLLQDIHFGNTTVGPHRHDLCFQLNDFDLKAYGSQGQQRTGILALKLAEIEFIKSESGEYPILLLDDVMSELDVKRRSQLLLFIRKKVQTFITATDGAYFPQNELEFRQARFFQVSQGQVQGV